MSSKDYYLYLNLLRKIKQILEDLKVKIDFKKISFMTDFENGLRKALKNVFNDAPIYGCYFHFIKNLWYKAKKYGLFKKALKKCKYIIIFSMKLYPYFSEEEMDLFLGDMENYIKNINNKCYLSFFEYFKKVWGKTNFLKFDRLNIDEFSKRTNNVCEWFHKKLKDTIDGYLAYLVEKVKDFSIDSYNKYKIEKSSFKSELISSTNLIDDILNFFKKYKKI